ncbi:MAG: hypothetical protein HQK87_04455 [Nitrospinae bacterium]|nr:hypothetical protein [Nitrospinota bacterium]
MKTIWRMAGRATATIFAALLVVATGSVGCGGSLVDNRPSNASDEPSLTLTASTKTQTSTTSPVVRANGRDSVLLEAEVSGLSQMVGFYIPATYGAISTTASTVIDVDGYVYFTADRSGVARATMVAGLSAGRSEIIARSKHITAALPVNFEFATLALSPATMTLSSQGARGVLTAFGAMPPVAFTSSDPAAIKLTKLDDTSVRAVVHDLGALVATGTTGVTINARDAEGQSATAVITAVLSCFNGTIAVSPTTGLAASGGGTATVSLLVTDQDRASWDSVEVMAHYPNGAAPATVTLTPWVTPGLFQANYTLTCGACVATDLIRFDYSDLGSDCQTPRVASATYTLG